MSAPVVALSSCLVSAPFDGRQEPLQGANVAYQRAVLRAGGLPFVLPYGIRGPRAAAVLQHADALVLTGGDDVRAGRVVPRPGHADPLRDASDAALLAAARGLGLPVLGVCRGMQLLAVRSGGRLGPAVGHAPQPGSPPCRHRVALVTGTWFAALPGVCDARVGSMHTFAVEDPGSLAVVARSTDGTVEAIAHPDRWELGVQWHPELGRGPLGPPVWAGLLAAAERFRAASPQGRPYPTMSLRSRPSSRTRTWAPL